MSRTIDHSRPIGLLALVTALAALCLALSPGRAAYAGAYTYGTTPQRTVNAGILLVDGNLTSGAPAAWPGVAKMDNPDPYVFYILSQRTDIVPFGWTITNPIAPGAVTSQVKLRWDNRTNGAASPLYQLGQSLTPAMAAYWEVPLTQTTSDDLARFDVLLLNVQNSFTLTAGDTEKLRRFVEGGGTLWIEDSYSPIGSGTPRQLNVGYNTAQNATLFGDLQFTGNTAGGTSYATLPSFTHSPLITTPYSLSENELNALGLNHIGNYYASNVAATATPTFLTKLSGVVNNSGSALQPVIASGQYGSGQVVVTCTGSANAVNDYVGGVDVYQVATVPHPNSGPFCGTAYTLAPTQDLKLVTDILASADGHPNEHQNTHQSGVSSSGLPAIAKSWSDTAIGDVGQTGVTVYGHMAYVTRGRTLYAYDLYPSEDLNGDGDPDDGTVKDYDKGFPFDTVWTAPVGTNASAPTVAQLPIAGVVTPIVLIELADGTVMRFNAADGSGTASLGSATTTYTSLSLTTPAPTVFENRVYAGRADGTLYMNDFGTGTVGTIAINRNVSETQAIIASPTVGIIPNSRGDNDIVALCTTGNGLYSVFLGSRGEALQRIGGGATPPYNTKLASLPQSRMDTTTALAYSAAGSPPGTPAFQASAAPNANAAVGNNFTGYGGTDPLYANYDADIAGSAASGAVQQPGALTRTVVGAAQNASNNAAVNAVVSTPALDKFGNVYYTVTYMTTGSPAATDSVLFCVHDAPNPADVHINWRFTLPQSAAPIASKDADNADYSLLTGYTFTASGVASAPVVDAQGNVYVLATRAAVGAGTSAATAVLCFNGTGTVSADIGDPNAQGSGINITQPINGGSDEFGDALTPTIGASQYTVGTGGHISFTNFGQESNAQGNGTHALYPNLNEPYPVTVTYNTNIGNAGNPTSVSGLVVPLHTNLAWYTVLDPSTSVTYTNPNNNTQSQIVSRPNAPAASGLTKAGNALYFVDANGLLDSVTASPQTITNKFVESAVNPYAVASTTPPVFSPGPDTGVGATAAVPSAGNGVVLVNGPKGTTAFTNQITLVVDSNRVLEMDSNGDAEWAVDATSKTTLAGGTTPIYNYDPTTSALGTGQFVTTTLELNRPTSLTELTQNDYLVADTGNNRCVRFDRAGKVIWELTKFSDSTTVPLLKPGEPDTLNQPTSVQIRTETDASKNTIVRYLISDTGNFRILEVDDVYDSSLRLVANHVLNWISHTHDFQDREYRYQSAAYYVVSDGTTTKYYVAALITNKRIATPLPTDSSGNPTGALLAANQDTAGGSIALLDYYPVGYPITSFTGALPVATNGYITGAISSISVYLTAAGGFDLATTASALAAPATAPKPQTLYLRNPRYLKAYVPQGATATTAKNLLIADDNGVFDLDGSTKPALARFGFTQADYRNMKNAITTGGATTTINTPINASGVAVVQNYTPRLQFPFLPSSIQLLPSTDAVTVGGSSVVLNRYLITNAYSQGEAANAVGTYTVGSTDFPGFGGEVFEVAHDGIGNVLAGGYGGHTLSRPTNTSPLNQPAFAYRLQQ